MTMAFAQYFLIDDYTASATYPSAGGSGAQISPTFSAGSEADAQTVAGNFATLFQRSVRLVPVAGSPPYTLFAPSGCGVFPSATPPSISF